MTIDVALLRELHFEYDPGFEHAYCYSCFDNATDLADAEWPCPTTELLDAYEERDRLREMLVRLRTRMAEPQQPIIQWDAGTWIERIDAALEGRE